MFAKTIIDSDAFLDMPLSSQALYFHLCIHADDFGVLNNAISIVKYIGGSNDDMQVLLDKNFLSRTNDKYQISEWDLVVGRGENARKRNTYEYRKWRETVLERDGYKCQHCGSNANLNVHHVKRFAYYKKLRHDIKNAITLCETCHRKLHREERINGGC